MVMSWWNYFSHLAVFAEPLHIYVIFCNKKGFLVMKITVNKQKLHNIFWTEIV